MEKVRVDTPPVASGDGVDGDMALLDRARAADGDPWESLHRLAYPSLLTFAARRLETDAARDAISETVTQAVR